MGKNWNLLIVLVAMAVVGLGVFGCSSELSIAPQCPSHARTLVYGPKQPQVLTTVKLAGAITLIPEFHDCQALLNHDGKTYGPVVGVWVSEHLAQLVDSLGVLNPTHLFIRPAGDSGWVLMDSTGLGPTQTVEPAQIIALPFAIVHAWNGPYPVLGIRRGWNCLYLYPSLTGVGLKAAMVPVADQAECFDPESVANLSGSANLTRLEVTVTSTGTPGTDIPPVGRWELDSTRNIQYVGLKCGAAWCSVTDRKPIATERTYRPMSTALAPLTPKEVRVLRVNGWFDQQPLAIRSGTGLAPSSIRGIVVPDPNLDAITTFETNQWTPVGWAGLSAPSKEYQAKLNLFPGKLPPAGEPGGGTDIAICTGDQCEFSNGTAPTGCQAAKDGRTWYMRLTRREGTGEVKYKCVERNDHKGMVAHVFGTARWRWVDNDETLWFRCEEGCCTAR